MSRRKDQGRVTPGTVLGVTLLVLFTVCSALIIGVLLMIGIMEAAHLVHEYLYLG